MSSPPSSFLFSDSLCFHFNIMRRGTLFPSWCFFPKESLPQKILTRFLHVFIEKTVLIFYILQVKCGIVAWVEYLGWSADILPILTYNILTVLTFYILVKLFFGEELGVFMVRKTLYLYLVCLFFSYQLFSFSSFFLLKSLKSPKVLNRDWMPF